MGCVGGKWRERSQELALVGFLCFHLYVLEIIGMISSTFHLWFWLRDVIFWVIETVEGVGLDMTQGVGAYLVVVGFFLDEAADVFGHGGWFGA